MPDSLTTTANNQRRALLADDRALLRRLAAAWRGVEQRIDQEVAKLLSGSPTLNQLYERERLNILRVQVQLLVQHYVNDLTEELVNSSAGQQGVDDALALIRVTESIPLIAIRPVVEQLALRPLLQSIAPETAQAIANALIQGVALGQGPREIARAINRVANVTLTRALTIARTETLRAYRESSRQAYLMNSGVVTAWIWHAALGPRTCAMCIAMHGTEHPLTETMATHPNCRCAMLPKTSTPMQIESGIDWFARQPTDVQRGILGPGKFKAHQAGALSLSDLVGTKQTIAYGPVRYERPLKEVTV